MYTIVTKISRRETCKKIKLDLQQFSIPHSEAFQFLFFILRQDFLQITMYFRIVFYV